MKNAGIATGIFEGGYKRAPDPGQLRDSSAADLSLKSDSDVSSAMLRNQTHPPAKPRNTRKNPQSQAGRGVAGLVRVTGVEPARMNTRS